MKSASFGIALLISGWLGSPALSAQPAVPESPVVMQSSTGGTEPYGNGLAIAIILVGGLATFGRKLASEELVRCSAVRRGAKVIEFPSAPQRLRRIK